MKDKIPSLLHGYEINYYTYDSNNNDYFKIMIINDEKHKLYDDVRHLEIILNKEFN